MEAIILLLKEVVPPLIELGVNAMPLLSAGRNTIGALETGNHVTAEQATELRAMTAKLEGRWADLLKAAEDEAKA